MGSLSPGPSVSSPEVSAVGETGSGGKHTLGENWNRESVTGTSGIRSLKEERQSQMAQRIRRQKTSHLDLAGLPVRDINLSLPRQVN